MHGLVVTARQIQIADELSDVVGFVCLSGYTDCRAVGLYFSRGSYYFWSCYSREKICGCLASGQESYRGAVSPLLGDLITATAY